MSVADGKVGLLEGRSQGMANAQDLPGSVAAELPRVPEYRELVRQHHTLEKRLHDLADHLHLSTEQHLEEVRLKKEKLAIKDQIASLRSAGRV